MREDIENQLKKALEKALESVDMPNEIKNREIDLIAIYLLSNNNIEIKIKLISPIDEPEYYI